MEYVKPEVVLLGPALTAIESGNPLKPVHISLDLDNRLSNGAYEADE